MRTRVAALAVAVLTAAGFLAAFTPGPASAASAFPGPAAFSGSATGTVVQRPSSQSSAVQGFRSSQSAAVVQAQPLVITVHPVTALQPATAHARVVRQSGLGPGTHTPPEHVSAPLHTSSSAHDVPSSSTTPGLHFALSAQHRHSCRKHPTHSWQSSNPLHGRPSSHIASVVQRTGQSGSGSKTQPPLRQTSRVHGSPSSQ